MAFDPCVCFLLVGSAPRMVPVSREVYDGLKKDEEIEERTRNYYDGVCFRELYDTVNDDVIAFRV